jgi:hypothetical protein
MDKRTNFVKACSHPKYFSSVHAINPDGTIGPLIDPDSLKIQVSDFALQVLTLLNTATGQLSLGGFNGARRRMDSREVDENGCAGD